MAILGKISKRGNYYPHHPEHRRARAGGRPAIESVLGHEKPDFVQIGYSIEDREAEKRILPLAAEVKAGVLTAEPLGRGRLFRAVRGKAVPDWAKDFAGSWAQFFLKYLLADKRITTVIPGTRRTWRIISAPCAAACPIRTSASGW